MTCPPTLTQPVRALSTPTQEDIPPAPRPRPFRLHQEPLPSEALALAEALGLAGAGPTSLLPWAGLLQSLSSDRGSQRFLLAGDSCASSRAW